jgi:hypothetical protein
MSATASGIRGGFAEVISSRIVDKMNTERHGSGFRGQVNASDNPLC